ncbi:unnamed protein product [Prunus brigantina]
MVRLVFVMVLLVLLKLSQSRECEDGDRDSACSARVFGSLPSAGLGLRVGPLFFFFFFFFRQWALIDVDVEAKQLAVPSVCQSASCPDNLCSFLVWWCFARDEPLLFWVSRSIWWLGKNCWYGDLTRELGQ